MDVTIEETIVYLEKHNVEGCFDSAILELRKSISMKVDVGEWIYTECPSCSYELSKHHGDGYYSIPKKYERCPNCYQKLDLGVEREDED